METDSPLATWREGVPLGNYSMGPTEKTKIVLHSTDGTFTAAVNWFLNPDSRVSAHYVIGRGHAGEPKIYQVVKESAISHHARNWVMNVKSIGIECADDELHYLTEPQRERLVALLKDIVKRHPNIRSGDIILHREVVATECPQAISNIETECIIYDVFNGSAPNWEAKYKDLKIKVEVEADILDEIIVDVEDVRDNLRRMIKE